MRSATGALTRRASASISGSASETRRSSAAARGDGVGGVHDDVDPVATQRRLQRRRRVLGDHAPAVDDRDPVGELVGLLELLGGQQHGDAFVHQRTNRRPDLVAPARVQARWSARPGTAPRGRGSARRRGRAGGACRPSTARPACCPCPPGRSAPATRPPAPGRARRPRWYSRPNRTRFWRPLSTSSTAALCPTSPIRRRTPAGSRATSTPATSARPPSARSSVVRIRTAVVLPAPLGPSRPKTLPGRHATGRSRRAPRPRRTACAGPPQEYLRTPYGVIPYRIRSSSDRVRRKRRTQPRAAVARADAAHAGARSPSSTSTGSSRPRSRSPTRRAWRRCRCARSPSAWASGRCRSTRTCPGKAELLDLMVDASVGPSTTVDGSWRERLEQIARESGSATTATRGCWRSRWSARSWARTSPPATSTSCTAIDGIGLTDIEMDAVITPDRRAHVEGAARRSLEAALAERRTGQSDQDGGRRARQFSNA